MGVIEAIGVPRPAYSAPVAITSDHRLEAFSSGKQPLDDWLKARANDNEGKASRTYVVEAANGPDSGNVVGYYTLATGSVVRDDVPRKIRQNLPNPVPVMVLGRLAVDERHTGKHLGSGMLKEAMVRTLEASRIAGVRALIVHAIDDEAVTFYAKWGFQVFPMGSRTMFLPIETLAASLAPEG